MKAMNSEAGIMHTVANLPLRAFAELHLVDVSPAHAQTRPLSRAQL